MSGRFLSIGFIALLGWALGCDSRQAVDPSPPPRQNPKVAQLAEEAKQQGRVLIDAGPDQLGPFRREGSTVTLPPAIFASYGGIRGLQATVDWGDQTITPGEMIWDAVLDAGEVEGDHIYVDEGRYTVTVSIGPTPQVALASDSFEVQVSNAPPVVGAPTARLEGKRLWLESVPFRDRGKLDNHSATIDWGDGASTTGELDADGQGGGVVRGDHVYSASGTFTVTVTVEDNDGASGAHRLNVDVGRLDVVDANDQPVRLAWGPYGRLYATDTKANSLFIYAYGGGSLTAEGQLKGLATPLGVAVDGAGKIYVGNDGRDNVEIYDQDGRRLGELGRKFAMPNDLLFDAAGNLYVVDSRAYTVSVLSPSGALLRTIGQGQLKFPCSAAIRGNELFVADQGHDRVQVYDLQGNFLRSFGGTVWFSVVGKFVTLQSIAFAPSGWLHALDVQQAAVQVFNPSSGQSDWAQHYDGSTTPGGRFKLPLDIAINESGLIAVAEPGNQRVTVLTP